MTCLSNSGCSGGNRSIHLSYRRIPTKVYIQLDGKVKPDVAAPIRGGRDSPISEQNHQRWESVGSYFPRGAGLRQGTMDDAGWIHARPVVVGRRCAWAAAASWIPCTRATVLLPFRRFGSYSD